MEIVSIYCNQNVNSVNVELKQWLYKNGNQCVWNTGGWMQCLYSSVPYHGTDSWNKDIYSDGTVSKSFTFTGSSINISESVSAPVRWGRANSGATYYVRGGGAVDVYAGTKKPLSISMSKYTHIKANATSAPTISARTGNANGSSTGATTPTVIASVTGLNNAISMPSAYPYFVVGKSLFAGYIGTPNGSSGVQGSGTVTTNPGDLNLSYTSVITGIWLE